MKKGRLIILASVTGIALLAMAVIFNPAGANFSGKKTSSRYTLAEFLKKVGPVKEHENIKDALNWIQRLRASNPADNSLDQKYVLQARQQVASMRRSRSYGPLELQWESLGPDNVGGRTRAILVDKDNSNLVYAGAVTGGLWVSHDGAISWQKHSLNDELGNHSISSIVQANNGDIYFGTGESYVITIQNGYGHIGGGIYKSTDGGTTFSALTATVPTPDSPTDQWSYVNALAIRYDNSAQGYSLYAATQSGLLVSPDGGASWSQVTGIPSTDANGRCHDVKTGSNGSVYTCLNGHYYRSSDGINFSNIGVTGFPGTLFCGLVIFAVSPQDPLYVYASIATPEDANGRSHMYGVFQSTDGGFTWANYSPVNSTAFNPLGDQGTYGNIITVSPVNKQKVYVAGQLEVWAGGDAVGWAQIATANGSVNYPYYIHADYHAFAFDPKNSDVLYVGCDGGIAKTVNAGDAQPVFTTRNQGYITTQFYGMAASSSGEVIAGAQDNGTSYIDFHQNTVQSAIFVYGSDGGNTYISKYDGTKIFAEDQFGLYRSSNNGASFGPFEDSWLTGNGYSFLFERQYDVWETDALMKIDTIRPSVINTTVATVIDTVSHGVYDTINVNVYDTIDPGEFVVHNPGNYQHNQQSTIAILMLGAYGHVVFTRDPTNFGITPSWFGFSVNGDCIAVASAGNGKFYCGTDIGYIYEIENLQDTTKTTYSVSATQGNIFRNSDGANNAHRSMHPAGINGRLISGIAVDPHNSSHIVVCLGGYGFTSNIYESFNADSLHPVFKSIQGNLPNMPVYSAVIDFYNSNNIIAGTDMGIWTRTDTSNNWGEDNTNLSSIPIYKMSQTYLYDTTCQVVYASSYGRGMFRTTTLVSKESPQACNLVADGINSPEVISVSSIKVYPNPSTDKAVVEIDMAEAADVKITVLDILGRVYQAKGYGHLSGKQSLTLDVSSLSPGNYFVSVQTGNKSSAKQIVVVR